MADDAWERRPDLIFALELQRAECEFLIGELPAAEKRLAELAHHAKSFSDLATVTRLRVDLFMTLVERTPRRRGRSRLPAPSRHPLVSASDQG